MPPTWHQSHTGGKRCETAYVVETAKMLAEVKGISLEELAVITTETAKTFFGVD